MPTDNIDDLYNAASNDYDLGSVDDFRASMAVPENRKNFYDAVSSKYDLGDYNSFDSIVSSNYSAEVVSPPVEPEKKNEVPIAEVSSDVQSQSLESDSQLESQEPTRSVDRKSLLDQIVSGGTLGGASPVMTGDNVLSGVSSDQFRVEPGRFDLDYEKKKLIYDNSDKILDELISSEDFLLETDGGSDRIAVADAAMDRNALLEADKKYVYDVTEQYRNELVSKYVDDIKLKNPDISEEDLGKLMEQMPEVVPSMEQLLPASAKERSYIGGSLNNFNIGLGDLFESMANAADYMRDFSVYVGGIGTTEVFNELGTDAIRKYRKGDSEDNAELMDIAEDELAKSFFKLSPISIPTSPISADEAIMGDMGNALRRIGKSLKTDFVSDDVVMPEGYVGKVLGGVATITPEIIATIAMPELKMAQLGVYTRGLIRGIPKFPALLATRNFVDTWDEIDYNDPYKFIKAAKEAGKGYGEGLVMEGMGLTGRSIGDIIGASKSVQKLFGKGKAKELTMVEEDILETPLTQDFAARAAKIGEGKSKTLGAVTSGLVTSTLFGVNGAYNAFIQDPNGVTTEDLLSAFAHDAGVGAVFHGKDMGKAIVNMMSRRTQYDFSTATRDQINEAINHPMTSVELREESNKLSEKIAEAEKGTERNGLILAKNKIDTMLGIRGFANVAISNPGKLIEDINADKRLNDVEKAYYADKINSLVVDHDPIIKKIDPILKDIDAKNVELDGIMSNTQLNESVKKALSSKVRQEIANLEIKIDDVISKDTGEKKIFESGVEVAEPSYKIGEKELTKDELVAEVAKAKEEGRDLVDIKIDNDIETEAIVKNILEPESKVEPIKTKEDATTEGEITKDNIQEYQEATQGRETAETISGDRTAEGREVKAEVSGYVSEPKRLKKSEIDPGVESVYRFESASGEGFIVKKQYELGDEGIKSRWAVSKNKDGSYPESGFFKTKKEATDYIESFFEVRKPEERKIDEVKIDEPVADVRNITPAQDAVKPIVDFIRSGKISKIEGFKSSTGLDAIWDGSLEIVARSIEGGAKLVDAVSEGLSNIKKSDWYTKMNAENQAEFDNKYKEHLINDIFSEHKRTSDTATQRRIDENLMVNRPNSRAIVNDAEYSSLVSRLRELERLDERAQRKGKREADRNARNLAREIKTIKKDIVKYIKSNVDSRDVQRDPVRKRELNEYISLVEKAETREDVHNAMNKIAEFKENRDVRISDKNITNLFEKNKPKKVAGKEVGKAVKIEYGDVLDTARMLYNNDVVAAKEKAALLESAIEAGRVSDDSNLMTEAQMDMVKTQLKVLKEDYVNDREAAIERMNDIASERIDLITERERINSENPADPRIIDIDKQMELDNIEMMLLNSIGKRKLDKDGNVTKDIDISAAEMKKIESDLKFFVENGRTAMKAREINKRIVNRKRIDAALDILTAEGELDVETARKKEEGSAIIKKVDDFIKWYRGGTESLTTLMEYMSRFEKGAIDPAISEKYSNESLRFDTKKEALDAAKDLGIEGYREEGGKYIPGVDKRKYSNESLRFDTKKEALAAAKDLGIEGYREEGGKYIPGVDAKEFSDARAKKINEFSDARAKKINESKRLGTTPFDNAMHQIAYKISDAFVKRNMDLKRELEAVSGVAHDMMGDGFIKEMTENKTRKQVELNVIDKKKAEEPRTLSGEELLLGARFEKERDVVEPRKTDTDNISRSEAMHLWMVYEAAKANGDKSIIESFRKNEGWDESTFNGKENSLYSFITNGGKDTGYVDFAKWVMNEFYPGYYHKINRAYERAYGVRLPNVGKYIPSFREGKTVDGQTATADNIINDYKSHVSVVPGSVKSRTPNLNKVLRMGMEDVLVSHINKMEHFIHMNEPLSAFRNIFKNKNVMDAISQFHGNNTNKIIDGFLSDMERGTTDPKGKASAIDKIRQNFVQAKIGLNVPVFIKQLTSVPAYWSFIDSKKIPEHIAIMGKSIAEDAYRLASGKTYKFGDKEYRTMADFMYRNSEYLQTRYDRLSFNREMEEIASGIDVKNLKKKGMSFRDFSMIMAKGGDKAAIVYGGFPVYKINFNEYSKKMSKAEAHEKAMSDFEKATQLTQQAGELSALSNVQRWGSMGKMLTLFQNSPLQYYRMEQAALTNLIHGRGSVVKNVKDLIIFHHVLPSLFQLASSGIGGSDTEDWVKVNALGSLGYAFIAKNIFDATYKRFVKGDDRANANIFLGDMVSDEVMNSFEKVMERIDEKTKEEIGDITVSEIFKFGKDLGNIVGDLTGAPIGNVLRYGEGWYDWGTDRSDSPMRVLGYSNYAIGDNVLNNPVNALIHRHLSDDSRNLETMLEEAKSMISDFDYRKKKSLTKKYMMFQEFGFDDEDVNELLKSSFILDNDDKADILIEMHDSAPSEEFFNEKFRKLRSYGVIGDGLVKKYIAKLNERGKR